MSFTQQEQQVFRNAGAVPQVQAGADPNDPANIIWNFGVLPSTPRVRLDRPPSFYEVFPNLQGRWDGKSNVNHHSAVRKVLGSDLPAHNQPTGTCFPAGTTVRLADDSSLAIEQVEVGMEVKTAEGRTGKVLRTMERPYNGELVGVGYGYGPSLWATPEHPVWVKGRRVSYQPFGTLHLGDKVAAITDAGYHTVRDLERKPFSGLVYNIEVEGDHSYFADGVGVHNCGGRAGSRSAEILQCVLIANGKRAKFHTVSHAWLYYLARKKYGMLGGGDGVAGGSIPPVMGDQGLLHREESGDTQWAGRSSDDLASKWGGGRLSQSDESVFLALAKDNLVTAVTQVRSAAELADALASGGVCCQSDMQGYSMTRDADGFCRAQGQWAHYQVRSGIVVTTRGRKGFAYDQSWGDDTPDGPRLEGYPGNCFGVDWDVQDQLCRNDEVHVLFAMDLWDLESGGFDLEWVW
jgi:hypothetical protein